MTNTIQHCYGLTLSTYHSTRPTISVPLAASGAALRGSTMMVPQLTECWSDRDAASSSAESLAFASSLLIASVNDLTVWTHQQRCRVPAEFYVAMDAFRCYLNTHYFQSSLSYPLAAMLNAPWFSYETLVLSSNSFIHSFIFVYKTKLTDRN